MSFVIRKWKNIQYRLPAKGDYRLKSNLKPCRVLSMGSPVITVSGQKLVRRAFSFLIYFLKSYRQGCGGWTGNWVIELRVGVINYWGRKCCRWYLSGFVSSGWISTIVRQYWDTSMSILLSFWLCNLVSANFQKKYIHNIYRVTRLFCFVGSMTKPRQSKFPKKNLNGLTRSSDLWHTLESSFATYFEAWTYEILPFGWRLVYATS